MSNDSADRFHRASRVLKALAHELRLEIVCGLRGEPCTQTFIAQKLGVPQPTIAQHLRVLRAEGLIKAERHGVEVVFSLNDPVLASILDTLCCKEDRKKTAKYSWDEIAANERTRRSVG
jgi:ArsR family transcriptional regulator